MSVVVIGSGLAGLLTARLLAEKTRVTMITKATLFDSNTQWSQGGIAAVWDPKDSVNLHIQDTVNAGGGLCDLEAVQVLAAQSQHAVQQLIDLGAQFDKDDQNQLVLGLEGAHSIHRVLHAGGDATGVEIQRALVASIQDHPNVEIKECTLATEIIKDGGEVSGVRILEIPSKSHQVLPTHKVVIAAGGSGQVFRYTSNPSGATGDGVILAYQAGATLMDLEFFQFHPTALCLPHAPNFLISEALRGEGAILRNTEGDAFMATQHPQKDLAPRDVVSRAIFHEMSQTPTKKVYLDATHLDSSLLEHRFPTIFKRCLQYGVDFRKEPIPVTPVAHYMIGGVASDLWGRTNIPGLFVCGEAARTGVHGANRLASNSLAEAAVFAMRVAEAMLHSEPEDHPQTFASSEQSLHFDINASASSDALPSLSKLQNIMWEHVGIIRNESSLKEALSLLKPKSFPNPLGQNREHFEFECMHLLGTLMAFMARHRHESRGAHYRSDYPTPDPHSVSNAIKGNS